MKKIFLAAALLSGCLPELPFEAAKNPHLAVPPPAPQGIRELPVGFAVDLVNNRKAKSVTMEIFKAGSMKVRGEAVSSLKSYHAKIELDVPVFLIRHSSAGNILVGTGLSPDKSRQKQPILDVLLPYSHSYFIKGKKDIVSQLARVGVGVEDVGTVLVPLWEPENVGMIDAFPNATTVLSVAERQFRLGKDRESANPISIKNIEEKIRVNPVDLSLSPAFGAFENGHDLFGDGSIYLVSLPGRTPGNFGVWVNLDEGPVLLTGGAAFVVDNYLDLALPIKERMHDLGEYWRSLHIVRAMRKSLPSLQVFAGNDLRSLAVPKRADLTIHLDKK